jgi:hypothetical protein
LLQRDVEEVTLVEEENKLSCCDLFQNLSCIFCVLTIRAKRNGASFGIVSFVSGTDSDDSVVRHGNRRKEAQKRPQSSWDCGLFRLVYTKTMTISRADLRAELN